MLITVERTKRPVEPTIATVLLGIYGLLVLFFALDVWLRIFGADQCGDACRGDLLNNTVGIFVAAEMLLFVILIAPFVLLRTRSKPSWWIPAAGIAVTLIGVNIAYAQIAIALRLA